MSAPFFRFRRADEIRHQRTRAYAWHRALIEACRPYRETHRPVLHAVGLHMRNAYGPRWYTNRQARELAIDTLHRFGVQVPLTSATETAR